MYRLPNSLLTTFLPTVHSCLSYTLRICIFVHLGGRSGSSKDDGGKGVHWPCFCFARAKLRTE